MADANVSGNSLDSDNRRPSPGALWMQAQKEHPEDVAAASARYRELLREHGHLVERKPGDDPNLPCGWPGQRVTELD